MLPKVKNTIWNAVYKIVGLKTTKSLLPDRMCNVIFSLRKTSTKYSTTQLPDIRGVDSSTFDDFQIFQGSLEYFFILHFRRVKIERIKEGKALKKS